MIPARENPFRVSRLHALHFVHESKSARDIANAFIRHGFRGAIIGPHGTGKTTAMLEVGLILRRRGHSIRQVQFWANEHMRNLKNAAHAAATIRGGDIILLDGIDQLQWISRPVLFLFGKRAKGILATSHSVTSLPTLLVTSSSAKLFELLLKKLVGESNVACNKEELSAVLTRFSGDIRASFRFLYDEWNRGASVWRDAVPGVRSHLSVGT